VGVSRNGGYLLTLLYNLFGFPRKNWLLISAGLPIIDSGDLDADTRNTILGLLTEYASRMIEARCSFTRVEWEALGEIERAAMCAAGNQSRVNQAIRIGEASDGYVGRAKVQSELDGGEKLEDVILHSFVSGLHELKQRERGANAG